MKIGFDVTTSRLKGVALLIRDNTGLRSLKTNPFSFLLVGMTQGFISQDTTMEMYSFVKSMLRCSPGAVGF